MEGMPRLCEYDPCTTNDTAKTGVSPLLAGREPSGKEAYPVKRGSQVYTENNSGCLENRYENNAATIFTMKTAAGE